MTPPQKLVLAPGAIIRGNTVHIFFINILKGQRISVIVTMHLIILRKTST